MDFFTTARLLMDIQRKHPEMRYDFSRFHDTVVITLPVDEGVPGMFESAKSMFEPGV